MKRRLEKALVLVFMLALAAANVSGAYSGRGGRRGACPGGPGLHR